MRSVALAFLCVLATFGLGLSPSAAQTKDVLVVAKHLDQVNNPAELERWWKDIINTPEGKFVADAVAAYFDCPKCGSETIEFIDANVVHLKDEGIEHNGVIQAPVGYTVCHANLLYPSVNCDGTFNGSYRTADDPRSGKFDGLHYYMVVPRPGVGGGRCWAEGTIVVTFVKATPQNALRSKCGMSGTVAFQHGK